MVIINQHDKSTKLMKSKIAILIFSILLLFACKQEVKNEDSNEFSKVEVSERSQEILQEKEKSSYIKNWIGVYSFGFGFRGNDENYEMNFKIDSTSATIAANGGKEITATMVRVTQDTLELKSAENRQYILYKENGGPNYAIRGSGVYMLNPPNDDYPLTKSKD